MGAALKISPPLLEPTKSPPAPRGIAFITLREASYRSAIPVETLARRARGAWSGIGLAALISPSEGGKSCWHVREDADPLFARGKSPAIMPIDWSKYTSAQRDVIHKRRAIVDAWMMARSEGFEQGLNERQITERFIHEQRERGSEASRGTLYRWLKKFNRLGQAGLVDSRICVGEDDGNRTAFVEELKNQYLSPRQRTVAMSYEKACDNWQDRELPIPFGIERARQILKAIDQKVAAYHRQGPRAYDSRFGKFLRGDYTGMESNDLWVSDGHTLNLFVRTPGKDKPIRPTLVHWQDVRSRMIVGWEIVAGSENSDVILAAFKMGVKSCGLPVSVYHDNGASYDARILQGRSKAQRLRHVRPQIDLGVFGRLQVGVKHALPFNAKTKQIERVHRTIDERFSREFLTYTGGDTSKKPFDLPDNLAQDKIPWLDEVIERFGYWLTAKYHNHPHDGADMNGETPAEVYRQNLRQARPMTDEQMELELSPRIRVTVGRNGIRANQHEYEAPELDAMMGQEVDVCIDNDDIGKVMVLRLDGSRLCVASTVRRVPRNAGKQELREAMAGIRRDRKRAREGHQAGLRLADDLTERLRREAMRLDASSAPLVPETIKAFPSKTKPEAGHTAEHMDVPPLRLAQSIDADEAILQDDLSHITLDDLVGIMERSKAVNQ